MPWEDLTTGRLISFLLTVHPTNTSGTFVSNVLTVSDTFWDDEAEFSLGGLKALF